MTTEELLDMNYDVLKFRAEWFKGREDKLETAAEDLRCLSGKIGAVNYAWDEVYLFAPLKPAYQAMVDALTSGDTGCDKGAKLLDDLREGIVTTGREYLRTEAENAGIASEIESLIEDLDL